MKRRHFVASVAAAGVTLATSAGQVAQADSGTATPTRDETGVTEGAIESGYAPVNGLQMYYEIHGSGEPLVLLHGAFNAISLWGPILTTLAEQHQVIAVEFQGHGHTADIDRPFGFERFADDVAGVMEHLGIAQADVVGYSLGGITALQVAMRHPERVRRLVAISANYRTDGYYSDATALIQTLTPELFAGSPPETAYFASAPNPDDWPVLFEKIKALEATEFAWADEAVAAIAAPTLVIVADADVVRPEHALALFRLLGGGVPGDLVGLPPSQLAIIPGATHVSLVVERSALWLPMVEAFLAAPAGDG